MSFGEAIKTCLRKYVDFSGRARRSEFWFFRLFVALIAATNIAIDYSGWAERPGIPATIISLLYLLVIFGLILPDFAVAVRRLHDTDHSGGWIFIVLVPLVGIILLLVWLCTKGTEGLNRFGPDPLDPSGALSGAFD